MDDAAAGKALAFQQVLHHLVVGVGVGAQALAVLQTPLHHRLADALALARRSQPVQRTVGQSVVEPLSVLNDLVSGILAKDKGKHRLHLAVYHVHEQPVGVDILFQQLRAWVIVPPLGRVAVFRHEFPRTGIDIQNPCHICSYRSAKHIHSSSLARALLRGVHLF